eukprot:COSAG06_NODE_8341_length_2199_cov_1.301905_2_plen_103_part_00
MCQRRRRSPADRSTAHAAAATRNRDRRIVRTSREQCSGCDEQAAGHHIRASGLAGFSLGHKFVWQSLSVITGNVLASFFFSRYMIIYMYQVESEYRDTYLDT